MGSVDLLEPGECLESESASGCKSTMRIQYQTKQQNDTMDTDICWERDTRDVNLNSN